MKLLKSRPHVTFIAFIILLFIIFTAGILIFHTTVTQTVQKEKGVSQELAETQSKLNRTQTLLFEIENELNKSKSDIETFDSLYTETNVELEKTESSLETTKRQLTSSQTLVQQQKTQLDSLINQNNNLIDLVEEYNTTIIELTDDVAKLEDDLNDVCNDWPSGSTPPNECD